MKTRCKLSLLVVLCAAASPLAQAQKNSFINHLGFQVRVPVKNTTFSGMMFEDGVSKGRQGIYLEINKHNIWKRAMGYSNTSIGLAYRNAGIDIKDGRYKGTQISYSSLEVPFGGGFYLNCPECGGITMIPIGINFSGYIGVPLKYGGTIYDATAPSKTPYTFGNKYEKPLVIGGVQAALTFTLSLGKAGIFRLMYGFDSGLLAMYRNADNATVKPPYETPLIGSQFVGLEYVIQKESK